MVANDHCHRHREGHGRLSRHSAEHWIDGGLVHGADPQRCALIRSFSHTPCMRDWIVWRIEVTEIPDDVHAGHTRGGDSKRGIVTPRQPIASARQTMLLRYLVMRAHAFTRHVRGRDKQIMAVPPKTPTLKAREDLRQEIAPNDRPNFNGWGPRTSPANSRTCPSRAPPPVLSAALRNTG